jgi:hypothetical protein
MLELVLKAAEGTEADDIEVMVVELEADDGYSAKMGAQPRDLICDLDFRACLRPPLKPKREKTRRPRVARPIIHANPRPRAPRRQRASYGARAGSGGDDDDGGDGPPSRPTPLAVLIARAEARALLWRAGVLDLANAIDELEAEAEVSGLLAAIGADEVAAIVADVFAQPAAVRWIADGWAAAAADYQRDRGQDALSVEIAGERLALLRALMADNVSLEHAAYELTATRERGAAAATLSAAEFLIQQNDAERLRKWLMRHSEGERVAILKHIERRREARR